MTTHTFSPSLSVPHGWRRRTDPAPGVVVAARGPRLSLSGVPAELVLFAGRVPDPDLLAWRRRALGELARTLPAFELEDDDDYELGGAPVAYRRFGHRHGSAEVISDQWAWLDPGGSGSGVVLTCSAAREDYLELCDLFEDLAGSVELRPRAA